MDLPSDFAKVRCPCGVLWRGVMASPIANVHSTSLEGKKRKKIC
jgi:hypothetical protein